MKFKNTFYALFVIVLTMPLANAQTYQSLSALKGATWSYYYQDMFLGITLGHTTLDKDTIINGKTYFMLSHKSQGSKYTYIHEDLDSLKFTFINQSDTVIFDLTIGIGIEKDYHTCWNGGQPLRYRIDSISTLYDANNVPRQAHYFSIFPKLGASTQNIWVEGLGSFPLGGISNTLPFACMSHFDYPRMLCVNDSMGNLIFRNLYESTCTKINVEEFEENSIAVFPNPATEFVVVDIPEKIQISEMKLIDLSGRVCANFEKPQGKFQINVSNLSKGIYFLNCTGPHEHRNYRIVVY